ncbi:MAG: M28 family metallopeptidase [Bacteroidota bacterium]
MKKAIILFIISLLCGVDVICQNNSFARSVVDTLSSAYYKGRGYTFNKELHAAEYIRNQFETLKIKPLNKDYFQPFKININAFPAEVVIVMGGSNLKPGVDFLVSPDSPSVDGDFSTVHIKRKDLLIQEELKKLIDKSQGKFIVIDETALDELSNEDQKNTDEIINALRYDPRLQHAGLVLLTNNKLTWHVAGFQSPRPCFIVKKESVKDNARSVKVKVEAVLKNDYQTQNVIGAIEGSSKPDSFLVVLAHYDHLGTMGADVYFPGANDNASGVAMLLSLAKQYTEHPPKYSMVFIALGAEEVGLLGAKAFVDDPLINLDKIKFLINFDLAGTGDDGIMVVNATVFEDEFARLTKLNEKYSLMESVQPRGEACISDHCLFYRQAVPCFYIYTLGGIAAYHDVYDRPETLPLTDFEDYLDLMIRFFDGF